MITIFTINDMLILLAYIVCPGHYLCKEHTDIKSNDPFCIVETSVCDGIQHCVTDEDETECGK